MTADRRRATDRKLDQAREKIEKAIESINEPSQQIYGIAALSAVELVSDIADKLHDMSEKQDEHGKALKTQSDSLRVHASEEQVLLAKVRGGMVVASLVGGGMFTLLLWVALGVVEDVRSNTEQIQLLSRDAAIHREHHAERDAMSPNGGHKP